MDSPPLSIKGDSANGDGDFHAALATDGIIDIAIHGLWTIEQVDRLFAALMPIHTAARALHDRVRVLIRLEAVQPPAVVEYVRDRAVAIKLPEDRNAVIVASFLSKLQITRVVNTRNFALFTDALGAREWLLRP